MLQVTHLISLLGISVEGKHFGTHVYTDWNKTGVRNKIVICMVLLAGLIPTYLLKKGAQAGSNGLGLSEEFKFKWMLTIVTGWYNFYCFGMVRWMCFKLGVINTNIPKPQTPLGSERNSEYGSETDRNHEEYNLKKHA